MSKQKVEALVERLWEDAMENPDGDCDECKFSSCATDYVPRPFGSGNVPMTTCECIVPDAKDCPVVEQIIAAAYQHVTVVAKKEGEDDAP